MTNPSEGRQKARQTLFDEGLHIREQVTGPDMF